MDAQKGTIKVRCPNPACRKVLAVKAELGGKKGRCPLCGQIMSIPLPPAGGGGKTMVGIAPPPEQPKPESAPAPPEAEKPPAPSTSPSEAPPEVPAPPPQEQVAAEPRAEETPQPPESAGQTAAEQEPRVEIGAPQTKGHPTPRTLQKVSEEAGELKLELSGGRLVVSGQLGYELNKEFKKKCDELLESSEQSLVIDLSKVPYLSSTHLGVIAPLFPRAKELGKTLTLIADARVARVLKLAGFDRLGKLEVLGES